MAFQVEEKGFIFNLIDGNTASVVRGTTTKKEIMIPAHVCGRDVVAITDFAFQDDQDIERVYLPYTLEEIGHNAFADCKNLVTVTQDRQGKAVTLGSGAFSQCVNLKKVLLKTDTIRGSAFEGCRSLRTFIFSEDCKYIGPNAFMNCTFTNIMFKGDASNELEIIATAFLCTKIENLYSSRSMTVYSPIPEACCLEAVLTKDTSIVCTEDTNLNDLAYLGYNISRWKT